MVSMGHYRAPDSLSVHALNDKPRCVKLPLRTLNTEELLELQEAVAARPRLLKRIKEEMRENGIVPARVLSAEESRRERQNAAQAFAALYRGDDMECLKKALDLRLSDHLTDNDRVVFAVNSSGTGKSRTTLELGARGNVFVFYCSLASPTALTIPVRTPILGEKLSRIKGTWELGVYLVSWLEVLSLYLTRGSLGSLEQAPAKWLEIQDLTSMSCSGHLQEIVAQRWLELETKWNLGGNEEEKEVLIQELTKSASENVLKQLCYTGKELKLLFVVDGLSSLEHNPFSALNRGLSRGVFKIGSSALVMAISNTTSAFNLATDNRSGATKLKPLWHFWSTIPQSHLNDTFLWKQDPRAWLVSMDRLSRYGRPIWQSRYANMQDENDLLELATAKLLNLDGLPKMPGVLNMEQAIALLQFTVGVHLNPRAELAADMVSGHMRTMILIRDKGRALWTVAASEPVLSEAASRWLQEPAVLSDVLEHLGTALDTHSVIAVDRGEIVSSILMMMAIWNCQASLSAWRLSPVLVVDYLRRAFGGDIEYGQFLEYGLVFFNRIVAVDHVPSQEELMKHFKLGEMLCGTTSNFAAGAHVKWIPVWDGTVMEVEHFSCIKISGKTNKELTGADVEISAECIGKLDISRLRLQGTQVCKNKTRILRLKIQGLKESPVFHADAIKDYSSSFSKLHKILTLNLCSGADEEDKAFIRRCAPWMSDESQQANKSACKKCSREFKSPLGLKRHCCKDLGHATET